jgi:hypothetical protein
VVAVAVAVVAVVSVVAAAAVNNVNNVNKAWLLYHHAHSNTLNIFFHPATRTKIKY